MNKSQIKIEAYRAIEKIVGSYFLRNLYLKRCVAKYVKADCIFIHIPKAAGTSVADVIIGSRAGHFTSLEVMNSIGEEKYKSIFSFAITRNPAMRLLSAYNYVKSGGGSHGGVRMEKEFSSKAFNNFNSFVSEWLVNQDLATINLLFKPQVEFVLDTNGNRNVDFIGKVEELNLVEIQLSKILNRIVKFGSKNITQTHNQLDIDSATLHIIKGIYARDYQMFNY